MRFLRIIGVLIIVVTCNLFSEAQTNTLELVTPGGDEFKSENISLEWSLGEIMTETFEGENLTLTQGFNQVMYTITSVKSKRKYQNIDVYPNPCNNHFFIDIKMEEDMKWFIRIIDVNGKSVQEEQLTNTINKVDIQSLENSMYFIQMFNKKNKVIKTLKLEKVR